MIACVGGRYWVTQSLYKGASPKAVEEGECAQLTLGEMDEVEMLYPVQAALHRTVNLGNFESARISATITALCEVSEQDEVYAHCVEVASAWVDIEAAKVKKEEPPENAIGVAWSDLRPKVVIVEMSYGLTLNMGNYESARMDVGRSVPSKPLDVTSVKAGVTDWLTAKIRERILVVRAKYGQSKDVGI
jgi:hypothetical protein